MKISIIMLLIAMSISWGYGSDDSDIGEGLFIDGEGYIGPYLANASDAENYSGNLSSNSSNITEDSMNRSEDSSNIGEGLFIDAEGYIGPFMANLSNNSSRNMSDDNLSTDGAMETRFNSEIVREGLVSDTRFEGDFLADLNGIMDRFSKFSSPFSGFSEERR